MGETTSFYDILGIAPTASESEIRTAYYGLAKTAHPDRNRDDPHAAERVRMASPLLPSSWSLAHGQML